MNKIFLLLLLLSALLLASCSTKYVCADGSVVKDLAACPKSLEKFNEPAVEEILAKSKNVESMSYDYKRVDKPLEKPLKVWAKGMWVKQELPVQREVLYRNDKDVIVFNIVEKTAQGYCESVNFCIKTGDSGAVDYQQYYLKTPLDWVDGLESVEKISEAKIGNRNVWQLRTKDGVDLWLDTYYGVPLRVDVGTERYAYQNIIFNRVEDEEVQFVELRDDVN